MPVQYATADSFRRVTGQQLKPILEILAQVTWPVPEAKIPTLIDQLGWTLTSNRVHIKADTHLPVNYAVGDFAKPDGELTYLIFYLTDIADDLADATALAAIQSAYRILTSEIQSIWGEPTGSQEPRDDDVAQTWWDLPTGSRLSVHNRPGKITAHFMYPRFAAAKRYYESHPREDYPELYEYDGDDSEN
ncbi:MAG: DUF6301 family protein [Propionibacteriaceae bacterium]|jgi:hypothetical protein|nr:DUF6301 family protein [Propionibacteriaceae bacterium]